MKKRVLAMLGAAALAGAAFGMQGAAESPTKTIRFLSIWPETDPNVEVFLELTKEYNAQSDTQVELDVEVISNDAIQRQVKIYNASNDLPEMFIYPGGRAMQELIKADVNVNIQEEFEKLGIYDCIDRGAVSLLKLLEGNQDEEGLYELPLGMNLEGFWYNKQMFAEYGIEVPETWDDLFAACDTLLENGVTPIGVGGMQKWPITRLINAYLMRAAGPDALQKASIGEMDFLSPEFVEAAQVVQDMAEKGYFGDGYMTLENADAEEMLVTGQCGFIYDGSWIVGNLLNSEETNPLGEDVGFFNIPVLEGSEADQTAYSTNCGSTLVLSKANYDEAMADWCAFVFPKVGNWVMEHYGAMKGYAVTESMEEQPYYTQMVSDEFEKIQVASLFFEAFMDDETATVAKDNAQALCLGMMDAEAYFQSIADYNQKYMDAQ
ncbi:MAG: extracellular solute-binding protein [Eubacteriales bacterium]|nr:extracellular solute-binding protein [Eubacteriales bacterium]